MRLGSPPSYEGRLYECTCTVVQQLIWPKCLRDVSLAKNEVASYQSSPVINQRFLLCFKELLIGDFPAGPFIWDARILLMFAETMKFSNIKRPFKDELTGSEPINFNCHFA